MSSSGRSVLLLGATGLVGSDCLRLLLADDAFTRVVVLTRRALAGGLASQKLEQHVVDFEHLTAEAGRFGVDQIICALGTTMKQAGSRARFRAVDFLYPVTAAHLGREKGASHFLVVSAVGADSGSRIFYNRIKGELEDALCVLSYPSLTIARPSTLVGEREQPRTGERLAGALAFVTPAKYRPVASRDVAQSLVAAARAGLLGVRVIESSEMRTAAT